ncbi:MAG: Rnase Y domain-containing protein [Dehalobacterium sp.]
MWLYYVIGILAGIIIGFLIGYFVRKKIAEAKIDSAEEAAKKILEDGYKDAEAKKTRSALRSKRRNSSYEIGC